MLDGIYYTPEELSKRFKLSLSTIYNLIEKGDIPSIKLGKCYRIPDKGLGDYLNAHSRTSAIAATHKNLPHVVGEFLKAIRNSGVKDSISDIILYGSRARGDFNKDSDVDILVIARELNSGFCDSISEMSDRAMSAFDYDEFLSVIQMSAEQWKEAGMLGTPFYNSVAKEGISLWKNV